MAELTSKLVDITAPSVIPPELKDLFGVAKLDGNDTAEFLYFKSETSIDPNKEYRFSVATIIIPAGFQLVEVGKGALSKPDDIQLSVKDALNKDFIGHVLLHLRDASLPFIKDLQHLCAEGILSVGGKICARLTTVSRITGFLVNGHYYVLNDLHTDTFVYSYITNQRAEDFKTHMFNWFKTIEMRDTNEGLAVGVEFDLECYDADKIFWANGVDLWLVQNDMRRNYRNQMHRLKPPQSEFSTPHYRRS